MTGLYIHVPFCAVKCPYCDFYSAPYRRETVQRYTEAVIRNIRAYPTGMLDTVYFGGGTPSLLTAAQIGSILDACAPRLAGDAEITLECNPSGDRSGYLRELRQIGVNRLSIGTQSFSDAQLRLIGRTHTAAQAAACVEAAYRAGFSNLSCDLMLALPQQTPAVLAQTIETLVHLPVTHVSAYLLQIEEGTPLSRDAALLAQCPEEDAAAALYLQAVSALEAAGLRQYEVSSFAKPGYESRHNLKYWQCAPYLGIGAGAHSCWEGRRFCVPKDLERFIEAPRQPEELIDAAPCDEEERLMLGLRLRCGVPVSALSDAAKNKLPALLGAGYAERCGERIALTARGFAVSNAVIGMLLGA